MATNDFTNIVDIKINASDAIKQITAYNVAIADNQKALQAMRKEEDADQQAITALTEKITAQKKERAELQKALQNEIKVERAQVDSLKGLRAELSNLTAQYDNLSKAQRNNDAVGGVLQKRIKQITAEIKGAEEATDRYYRNVGNYTNSILSAVGVNGQFASQLVAMGESGASGVIAGMASSVKAFGVACGALLTNPAFLALAGIAGVGATFKLWFDYNKGLAEANRLTREFTGYRGAELDDLRSKIMATADVMGKEYTDVLKSVDVLMAHYHITGAEAMDVINKGFQAGADINGDFLASLVRNTAQMHDLGVITEQLVSLITQTRSGVFTEQGMLALAKGAERLRLMSDQTANAINNLGLNAKQMQKDIESGQITIFEALQSVSAKIKELPANSQVSAEAIKQVFSKLALSASHEMIAGFADMELELDKVVAQTGAYGQLLGEQISTQEELEKATADLFGVTGGGFEEVTMKAKIYATDALVKVVHGIQNTINAVKSLWKAIKGAGEITGVFFGEMALATHNAIKSLSNLGDAFGGLGDMLAGHFEDGFNRIKNAVKNTANGVVNSFSSAFGTISSRWGAISAGIYGDDESTAQDFSDKSKYQQGGGGGGATPTKAGKGGKTGKTAKESIDKEAEKRKRLAEQLAKTAEQARLDAQKAIMRTGEEVNAYYDARIEAIKKQYADLGTLSAEEQTNLNTLIQQINDERAKAIEERTKKEAEQIRADADAYLQMQLNITEKGSEQEMILRLAQLDLQYQAEQEKYQGNAEMLELLHKEHVARQMEIEKEYTDATARAEMARVEAIAGALGSLSGALDKYGKQSKAMAVASKVLAFGQIATSQGVAIAKGIAQAQSVPFPANIGAIATTIASILAGITQAISAVNSAKFATGGYVSGAGTATSDSIHARLSNGESVVNANSTAMFSGLLSSLNMLGGGVPIQAGESSANAQGEEMLARAFARGASALPAPVVGVDEITRVSNRVVNVQEIARV